MAKRGRFIDTSSSESNFLAIWNKLHALDEQLTAAQGTVAEQATTIADLNTQIAAANQSVQQALIAAGKPTSSVASVPPGDSGGDSGGGGGNGTDHPNYASLVQQAKDDLITEGEDLTGPCGGFKIVRRAVQYIAPSDPAVGLLDKPSGTNCMNYSIDIIVFNDGLAYDVLYDSGGANTVQWNFIGGGLQDRYRPPF